ncbi:type II toxin-antitoxin system RatA family toxin [Aestuariicella hydrocarbonica]|uniref:Type II toxin-antitoxin system RatA family toxin n=1 Tax=Pseudomaricurvus hydrocarbonicus TaxID=1470433 RepID=A0A9E5JWS0_9GAMM|nr:type II toxin-antitoxin system RatA family toxin [Aestuariicella hydrocarbonica]
MTQIHRSALVAYSDQKMFELVNDIETYPHYMDGCVGAKVLERSSVEVTARLDLKKMGVSYSFTTRNLLDAPHTMDMNLVEGPFKRLKGVWTFRALAEDACKVSLDLEFEFNNSLMAKTAGKLFESVANELVDGLCRRAKQVYG